MYTIIYKSTMSSGLTHNDIRSLLYYARSFNHENNISGCIFYGNQQFLQLIEGHQEVIVSLYKRIKNDNRHHSIQLLYDSTTQEKMFKDWNMVFFNVKLFQDFKNDNDNLLKSVLTELSLKNSKVESLKILRKEIENLHSNSDESIV